MIALTLPPRNSSYSSSDSSAIDTGRGARYCKNDSTDEFQIFDGFNTLSLPVKVLKNTGTGVGLIPGAADLC